MSQPNSCKFNRIIPTTCAPSTAERTLHPRQPAKFLGWQHHARHGWNVAEEHQACPWGDGIIEKIQHRRRVRHRLRQRDLLHHDSVALRAQVPRLLAPGCSWSVINTSSPGFMSRPFAMKLFASVALRTSASSSRVHPMNSASGIAKLVPRAVSPNRIIFRIALRIFSVSL